MGRNRREIGWGGVVINTWDWYRTLPAYASTTTTTTTSTSTSTSTTTTTTTSTTSTTTTTTTLAPASWTVFGSTSAAFATNGPPAMARLSDDLIAYGNAGGTPFIRTYQQAGGTWSQVGNALNPGYTTVLAMTALTSTSVLAAISDVGVSGAQIIQRYVWNGTNWAASGGPWGVGQRNWATLSAITSTTGFYAHDSGNLVYIIDPGTGTWQAAGFTSAAALGLGFGTPRSCSMGGNRIAYVNGNQLACLELSGVNFVVVGNILTTTGGTFPSVAYYSANTITWVEGSIGGSQIRKYFFDGTNWILQPGPGVYTEAGITAVAMFQSNKAVVGNNGTDNLINYQYS